MKGIILFLVGLAATVAAAGPELIDVAGTARAENFIVYVDGHEYIYYLYLVTLDGERYADLHCSGLTPSFSPDGRKIAFASDRDGDYEIYVMNADGSAPTRLTHNYENDICPVWSPDGRKIAYASGPYDSHEIHVVNVDRSARTRLTYNEANDSNPAWSPDGRRIAFSSNRDGAYDIYVMNADGSSQTRLTHNDAGIDCNGLACSPDGGKIAFSYWRDGSYEIYVMSADGSGQHCLTYDDAQAGSVWSSSPVWSPDGRKVAFASGLYGDYEIYVANADGSAPTRLTQSGGRSPSFSPMRANGVLYDTYGHVIDDGGIQQDVVEYVAYAVYADESDLRAEPSLEAEVLAVLPAGAVVKRKPFLPTEENEGQRPSASDGFVRGDDIEWVNVLAGDAYGWVPAEDIIPRYLYDAYGEADRLGKAGDAAGMAAAVEAATAAQEGDAVPSPDGRKVAVAVPVYDDCNPYYSWLPFLHFETGKGLVLCTGGTTALGLWSPDSRYFAFAERRETRFDVVKTLYMFDTLTLDQEYLGDTNDAVPMEYLNGYFIWLRFPFEGGIELAAYELASGKTTVILKGDEATMRSDVDTFGRDEWNLVPAGPLPPALEGSRLYEEFNGAYVLDLAGRV